MSPYCLGTWLACVLCLAAGWYIRGVVRSDVMPPDHVDVYESGFSAGYSQRDYDDSK